MFIKSRYSMTGVPIEGSGALVNMSGYERLMIMAFEDTVVNGRSLTNSPEQAYGLAFPGTYCLALKSENSAKAAIILAEFRSEEVEKDEGFAYLSQCQDVIEKALQDNKQIADITGVPYPSGKRK